MGSNEGWRREVESVLFEESYFLKLFLESLRCNSNAEVLGCLSDALEEGKSM